MEFMLKNLLFEWSDFVLSGTTLLLSILVDKTLIVANVGDSRGVMATRSGDIIPLSYDHKPSQVKLK